jgi:hypothetical protein
MAWRALGQRLRHQVHCKAIAINAMPRPVQWWQSFAEKGRAKHSDERDALFSIGAPHGIAYFQGAEVADSGLLGDKTR